MVFILRLNGEIIFFEQKLGHMIDWTVSLMWDQYKKRFTMLIKLQAYRLVIVNYTISKSPLLKLLFSQPEYKLIMCRDNATLNLVPPDIRA